MGPGVEHAVGVLERERELARIAAALDRAAASAGSLLLIEGEPGIGKTALLDCGRAAGCERGMLVLSARATELEREYPFGVVRQLLDPVLRGARGRRRERLLDGVGDAAALWPALAGEQGQASEFATLNGLWWLLANLAEERPVLATVDDLQWCDEESLRFLGFLAPRLGELPIALIGAVRHGQLRGVGPLGQVGWGPPLIPAPLSEAGCAGVAAETFRRSVDEEFCSACSEATGGNPFYLHALLEELARDRVEPVAAMAARVLALRPSRVTNSIAARLAALPAGAVALAQGLAILGEGAPAPQLGALAGLEPLAIADAAERLVWAGILAPGGELRFTHPIVAGAVEGDIDGAERDRLHRRSAALLANLGAAAEQTAAQLLACRPAGDPNAVEVLAAASRQALARGAPRSAVGYLRRALAEPPERQGRLSLLIELGLAEFRLDGEAAIEHLREALALAEPEMRATVAAMLAGVLLSADRAHEAAAAASDALSVLPGEDRETRRFLQATLLLCAQIVPALEWAREQVRSQLAGLEHEHGTGARLLDVVVALDDARHLAAPASALTARVQRALKDGCLLSAEGLIGMGLGAAIPVLVIANPDLAISLIEQGLDVARTQGDVLALASLRLDGCQARTLRGQLPEALADGAQGLELSSTWGIDFALEWGSAYVAVAKLEAGDLEGAERLLSGITPIAAELRQHGSSLAVLDGRMQLDFARGRFQACLDDAAELEKRAEALGWHNPAFLAWRSFTALCLAALGEQPERARELAAEEVELARRWAAPQALGAALRAQALVHDAATGEQCLREAAEVLEGSPARLEHARALVELGALLRRNGQRTRARPPLRAGLDLARACGAARLAERAYHELRATGASPRKLTRTGVATLTASEHRVAQMAASGRTNRQIAQELFVTVKTVESHLAGAYRKLDISSRGELAGKLGSGVPVSQPAPAGAPLPRP